MSRWEDRARELCCGRRGDGRFLCISLKEEIEGEVARGCWGRWLWCCFCRLFGRLLGVGRCCVGWLVVDGFEERLCVEGKGGFSRIVGEGRVSVAHLELFGAGM